MVNAVEFVFEARAEKENEEILNYQYAMAAAYDAPFDEAEQANWEFNQIEAYFAGQEDADDGQDDQQESAGAFFIGGSDDQQGEQEEEYSYGAFTGSYKGFKPGGKPMGKGSYGKSMDKGKGMKPTPPYWTDRPPFPTPSPYYQGQSKGFGFGKGSGKGFGNAYIAEAYGADSWNKGKGFWPPSKGKGKFSGPPQKGFWQAPPWPQPQYTNPGQYFPRPKGLKSNDAGKGQDKGKKKGKTNSKTTLTASIEAGEDEEAEINANNDDTEYNSKA